MNAPRRIDDTYEILGELARGGMGVVYRARDTQVGREVALKLIQGQRFSERQRERFQREGILAAALDHPGIVRVHACGEHDGQPYLVQELVEDARTLDDVFRERPLEERVALVLEVARAVAHAHAQGVIHRDLKPANMLVGPEGRVRVTDFGLATRADLDHLTRTGELIGTPTHMAPEQFSGAVGAETEATDVWALGVLLYQALTGELPFHGATLMELAGEVEAATPSAPHTVAPTVSPALEAACLRALRRSPAERFADAGAFADAIEAARGQRSRLRPRPALLGTVALLALGGVAIALREPASPPPTDPPPTAIASTPEPSSTPPPERDPEFETLPKGPAALRRASLEDWLQRVGRDHPQRAAARRELFTRPLVRLISKLGGFGSPTFLSDRAFLLRTPFALRLYQIDEQADGSVALVLLKRAQLQRISLIQSSSQPPRFDLARHGPLPTIHRDRTVDDLFARPVLSPRRLPQRGDIPVSFSWISVSRTSHAATPTWAFLQRHANGDGRIHLVEAPPDAPPRARVWRKIGSRLASQLTLSPDGRWLVVSLQTDDSNRWDIELHDLRESSRRWAFRTRSAAKLLRFSPDSDQLVAAVGAGMLLAFRPPSNARPIVVRQAPQESVPREGPAEPPVKSGFFAHDAHTLVLLASRRNVIPQLHHPPRLRCYDTNTWKERPEGYLDDPSLPALWCAESPDGRYLVLSDTKALELRRFTVGPE